MLARFMDAKPGATFALKKICRAPFQHHKLAMAAAEAKFEERRARGETEWAEAETEDGEVYYFNKRTRETCWELPSDEVLFAEIAALPTAEVVIEPMEVEIVDDRIERMRSQ